MSRHWSQVSFLQIWKLWMRIPGQMLSNKRMRIWSPIFRVRLMVSQMIWRNKGMMNLHPWNRCDFILWLFDCLICNLYYIHNYMHTYTYIYIVYYTRMHVCMYIDVCVCMCMCKSQFFQWTFCRSSLVFGFCANPDGWCTKSIPHFVFYDTVFEGCWLHEFCLYRFFFNWWT